MTTKLMKKLRISGERSRSASPSLSGATFGDADADDEQRHGDGEDGVAEERQADRGRTL